MLTNVFGTSNIRSTARRHFGSIFGLESQLLLSCYRRWLAFFYGITLPARDFEKEARRKSCDHCWSGRRSTNKKAKPVCCCSARFWTFQAYGWSPFVSQCHGYHPLQYSHFWILVFHGMCNFHIIWSYQHCSLKLWSLEPHYHTNIHWSIPLQFLNHWIVLFAVRFGSHDWIYWIWTVFGLATCV